MCSIHFPDPRTSVVTLDYLLLCCFWDQQKKNTDFTVKKKILNLSGDTALYLSYVEFFSVDFRQNQRTFIFM